MNSAFAMRWFQTFISQQTKCENVNKSSHTDTPEHTECIHNYSLISLLLYRVNAQCLFDCLYVCWFFHVFIVIIAIAIAVEYLYRYDGICRACLLVTGIQKSTHAFLFPHSHLLNSMNRLHSLSHRCNCCWHTFYAPSIQFKRILHCLHTQIHIRAHVRAC